MTTLPSGRSRQHSIKDEREALMTESTFRTNETNEVPPSRGEDADLDDLIEDLRQVYHTPPLDISKRAYLELCLTVAEMLDGESEGPLNSSALYYRLSGHARLEIDPSKGGLGITNLADVPSTLTAECRKYKELYSIGYTTEHAYDALQQLNGGPAEAAEAIDELENTGDLSLTEQLLSPPANTKGHTGRDQPHGQNRSGIPNGEGRTASDGDDDVAGWVQELIDKHLEELREGREEEAKALRRMRRRDDFWSRVNVQAFLANEHERKEEKWGTDYRIEIDQYGIKPDSEEFLHETQGDLPDHLHVNTDRFLALPRRAVEDLKEFSAGGLTWGDTVRMEIPSVSYLAGLTAQQPEGERVIEYDHGDTVTVPEGQIVVSVQKVARALYERFYWYPTRRADINSDQRFTLFYKGVVRALQRLTDTSVLDHHGPAIDTGDRKSDAYGQRYSVNIPNLFSLPLASTTPSLSTASKKPMPPAGSYVDTFVAEGSDGRAVVDVAAMFDELVREHTDQWKTFREQAVKSTTASKDEAENFRVGERGVDGFSWQRRQARESTVDRDDGQENSRHVTTGAYKEGHATSDDRSHLPCAIPFIVLEIDGETPQLCLEYARWIIRWLDSMDVPLESLTVTYTGNRSFHIRVPAGLFGKPVFRSTREATKTIRELYDMIEDEIDRLGGAHVDSALASPLHHIRAVGSVHEGLYSKESKTRYCVAFSGEELLHFSLGAIREFSARYDGYTLPRPGEAPYHEGLHDLLQEAHSRARASREEEDGSMTASRGIIDKIRLEGIDKGEEFYSGYVGRNLAARLLSLHLLQSGLSTQDAWLALQDWNEKNSPPLGEAPGDYTRELRYVFERAEEDAPHL